MSRIRLSRFFVFCAFGLSVILGSCRKRAVFLAEETPMPLYSIGLDTSSRPYDAVSLGNPTTVYVKKLGSDLFILEDGLVARGGVCKDPVVGCAAGIVGLDKKDGRPGFSEGQLLRGITLTKLGAGDLRVTVKRSLTSAASGILRFIIGNSPMILGIPILITGKDPSPVKNIRMSVEVESGLSPSPKMSVVSSVISNDNNRVEVKGDLAFQKDKVTDQTLEATLNNRYYLVLKITLNDIAAWHRAAQGNHKLVFTGKADGYATEKHTLELAFEN